MSCDEVPRGCRRGLAESNKSIRSRRLLLLCNQRCSQWRKISLLGPVAEARTSTSRKGYSFVAPTNPTSSGCSLSESIDYRELLMRNAVLIRRRLLSIMLHMYLGRVASRPPALHADPIYSPIDIEGRSRMECFSCRFHMVSGFLCL